MTEPGGDTDPEGDATSSGGSAAEAAASLRRRLGEEGARTGRADGRSVILSFGEPGEEYRVLRESVALVDDTDRVVLEVRGPAAREHFGGLVTNHVEELEPGRGLYAFMLTPRGRPVAEMRVMARDPRDGEEILLVDMPAACADGALEHLGRYLPPRLASFERRDDLVRLGLLGPRSREALEEVASGGLPEEPLEAREIGTRDLDVDPPAEAVRREDVEGPGFDLYVPAGDLPATWDRLAGAVSRHSGRPAGHLAREIWRVERGVPAYGPEINPGVLPQETGQTERAVDFDKGCYTGQEVVARIHYRGKVNRHLRGLRFEPEPEELPASGRELFDGDRSRGTVTTAVRSPRLGAVALGYVRREVEPGDALALEPEGPDVCRVAELPFGG